MGKNDRIDHARFLEMLTAEFPEVPQSIDDCRRGLLHCEMGAFARLTEEAIDEGRFWLVQKYFIFLERVRESASPELKNAVDVSYVEFLAFSEITENRLKAMKTMPNTLRRILLEIDGRDRWI